MGFYGRGLCLLICFQSLVGVFLFGFFFCVFLLVFFHYCHLNAFVLYRVHQSSFTVGPCIKDQKLRSPCMLLDSSLDLVDTRLRYVRGWTISIPTKHLSGCTQLSPDGAKLAKQEGVNIPAS